MVQRAQGERSYHIFYQLCSGAPPLLKSNHTVTFYGCLTVAKCKIDFVQISSFSLPNSIFPLHAYAAAEKLYLKSANDYNYLKQSHCLRIDGVDDSKKFTVLVVIIGKIQTPQPVPRGLLVSYCYSSHFFFHMQDALDTLQISKEDQMKLFSMLAAVLWLGNISFSVADTENHVEVVSNEGTIPLVNVQLLPLAYPLENVPKKCTRIYQIILIGLCQKLV